MNIHFKQNDKLQLRKANAGLTIVELMIGMTISLVLMAGIIQIFAGSKQSYKMTEALTYLQENGRFSIELITKDLRRTGFWGANGQVMRDKVTQNILGTTPFVPVTAANYDKCPGTSWGIMLEQRIFAINDSAGSYAGAGCIPSTGDGAYLKGDVLTIRYANPQVTNAFEAGRYYIRSSTQSGRLFTGGSSASAANIPNDNTPIEARELVANSYYIGDTGSSSNCTSGGNIPALYRTVLDSNGSPETQKIFEGVEQLQVQLGWDIDGDRIADRYVNANQIPDETPWIWDGLFPFTNKVVAARVWVLVRQECADVTYTNGNTYKMGDQTFTPADNYRRQLYTSTIRFRN